MKPLLKMYRFQSMGEFRALLSLYNIGMEEVKGEVNGRSYHGILYSALDKDGEKICTPIKSSVLGKMTGVVSLEKQIKQSGTTIKKKNLKNVPVILFPLPCNAPEQNRTFARSFLHKALI